MGLIRIILFALAALIAWRMYKNYLHKKKATSQKKLSGGKMVSCEYCRVHLPEDLALQHQSLWFCSTEHRQKYLDRQD